MNKSFRKLTIGMLGIGFLIFLAIGFSQNPPAKKSEMGVQRKPQRLESKLSGKTAPDFSLKNSNGEDVSLKSYEGKVVLINFWATWCPPCKREIKGFVNLQKKYGKDLTIVGISLDDMGPKAVLPFAKQFGINYAILYADSKVLRDYGNIEAIPTTFLLDRNLKIVKKYIGYQPDDVFEKDVVAVI